MTANNRSVSRGREGFPPSDGDGLGNIQHSSASRDSGANLPRGRDKISTGRGGVGNIVHSPSRDIEPESRGHINSAGIAPNALSSGRGGAGNIRFPSREARGGPEHSQTPDSIAEYEREVIQRHAKARDDVHVTGRGGLGNISTSKSRSRSRSQGPGFHSSGRGGAGNIQHGAGDPERVDVQDDEERLKHAHTDGVHFTGRGGLANVMSARGPSIEVVHHHDAPFESSGRGGAGNIRDRSISREPGSRNTSRERISHIWNKVTHPHQHVHIEDPDSAKEAPDNEGD